MCGIRKGSAVLVLFFKPAVMSPKLDLWIPSPCGPYVTHNAIWPLEETYEVICRFSGATEGFILLFHIRCRTPKDLQTHLNVLICQSYLLILNFSLWNVKTQNLKLHLLYYTVETVENVRLSRSDCFSYSLTTVSLLSSIVSLKV